MPGVWNLSVTRRWRTVSWRNVVVLRIGQGGDWKGRFGIEEGTDGDGMETEESRMDGDGVQIEERQTEVVCFHCGEAGYKRFSCPMPPQPSLCFYCGEAGYKRFSCPMPPQPSQSEEGNLQF